GFQRVTVNGMPAFINYYLLKFDKIYQNALKLLENYSYKIISKCQQETDLNKKAINLVASLVSTLQEDEAAEMLKHEEDKTGLTKHELLGEVL
ncbi:unnamed protein product, partial [Didymodactylos carnosus]